MDFYMTRFLLSKMWRLIDNETHKLNWSNRLDKGHANENLFTIAITVYANFFDGAVLPYSRVCGFWLSHYSGRRRKNRCFTKQF
jgi:hypothetical protein